LNGVWISVRKPTRNFMINAHLNVINMGLSDVHDLNVTDTKFLRYTPYGIYPLDGINMMFLRCSQMYTTCLFKVGFSVAYALNKYRGR